MTGPEHYRGAERLLKETEERRNARSTEPRGA
jgi:hypothetical protein